MRDLPAEARVEPGDEDCLRGPAGALLGEVLLASADAPLPLAEAALDAALCVRPLVAARAGVEALEPFEDDRPRDPDRLEDPREVLAAMSEPPSLSCCVPGVYPEGSRSKRLQPSDPQA